MDANFAPNYEETGGLRPFKYWCQITLPAVYDDSLSYYETLCKLVKVVNEVINNTETMGNNVENLHTAYEQLQGYVNMYFNNLDLQDEIDKKIDQLVEDGVFDDTIRELFNSYTKIVDQKIAKQDSDINGINNKVNVLENRVTNLSKLGEGSTTGDAELTDIRVAYTGKTYPTAGASVRAQAEIMATSQQDFIDFSEYVNNYSEFSNGHFSILNISATSLVKSYEENDAGNIVERNITYMGTPIMKCPKHLFFHSMTSSARFVVYFYQLIDGQFVPVWDIYKHKTSNNILNYVNHTTMNRARIDDIPDGTYVQFANADGKNIVCGWDGVYCGLQVTASPVTYDQYGKPGALGKNGQQSTVVPGISTCVFSSRYDIPINRIVGVKNGTKTVISKANEGFYYFPEGYDFFVVNFTLGSTTTISGYLDDVINLICPNKTLMRSTAGAKLVENVAKELTSIEWEAKINTPASETTTFKKGVKYRGIPYASNWQNGRMIGWHISPHTFINACNDVDSAFYTDESVIANKRPYYGTVCSAFASMCCGFDIPVRNSSFLIDPAMNYFESYTPVAGNIWSDVNYDVDSLHCCVPVEVSSLLENEAIRTYESVRPLASSRIKYSNLNEQDDPDTLNSFSGDTYFNEMHISCNRANAFPSISRVPYWDLATVTITNADALPWKGDKCVYTYNEVAELNIKNGASVVYIKDPDGNIVGIEANGASKIEINEYLTISGIYEFYTNTSNVVSKIEYIAKEKDIECTITNGVLSFNDDIWYSVCQITVDESNPYFANRNLRIDVANDSNNNYNKWVGRGKFTDCICAYKKGQFGAYVLPVIVNIVNT